MALDFPTSPTNGQVYGNFIYSSSKGAWQAKPITGKVTTSATAPSAPSNGDEWFNTNDGNIYVYYTDVDGSQWVQVKSDATLSSTLGNRVELLEAKPSGLVPIVPGSLTASSGTASSSSTGLVTFSGAGSISLNNIFTSAYTNYHIKIFQLTASVDGATIGLRYRAAGTDLSTSTYYQAGVSSPNASGAVNNWGTGVSSFGDLGRGRPGTNANFSESLVSFSPAVSGKNTMTTWNGWWENSSSGYFINASQIVNNTNSYDGFTVLAAAGGGTISGLIQVYGYR